jgi:hypothetical protein
MGTRTSRREKTAESQFGANCAFLVSATIQFRAVFIEVENSAELREFRERLRDIISALSLIPPHISPSLTTSPATMTRSDSLALGPLVPPTVCDSRRSGLP